MAIRPFRRRTRRRWLVLAALALIAFLYYQPFRAYLDSRSALTSRRADVARLRAEERALQRRLTRSTSLEELGQQARTLGYVKPGERLVIVKGVEAWRRARHSLRATIAGDG